MRLVKELWEYREMIISLVKRDLKSRYKGSVLGFFWMFLNPLLQLCVYTVVFSIIMRMNNYYVSWVLNSYEKSSIGQLG